ncbi:MAG: hypothetical protein A2842_00240 [Candidatus Wildermuthbacteria bacterium RIFCSPHIGHO2_01_FULL_48_25]|nr:MAG: hypothetical protein A2842_00240 [Candidatus Wildermuthbacteria bacterium RIFCSPHIGHO2_01_FULL_48_25]
MCFSATASFVAGGVLSAAGAVTITRAKTKKELPFALVPILFGIQQLTEGFVWLSFSFQAATLNLVATYIFSLFAFVVWPIYVPFAIGLLETVPWRKKVIYIFQVAGLIVGAYLLYFHTLSPATSEIVSRHVVYNNSHFYQFTVMLLYFGATIAICLFSSKRIINVFGVLAFLFALIAYWFYTSAFVSVWCFFAAILSIIVYWHFRSKSLERINKEIIN